MLTRASTLHMSHDGHASRTSLRGTTCGQVDDVPAMRGRMEAPRRPSQRVHGKQDTRPHQCLCMAHQRRPPSSYQSSQSRSYSDPKFTCRLCRCSNHF